MQLFTNRFPGSTQQSSDELTETIQTRIYCKILAMAICTVHEARRQLYEENHKDIQKHRAGLLVYSPVSAC
jgi:hypothetical protein